MARNQIARKVYVHADGTEGRSAKPGWTALRFDLFGAEKDADGKPVVVSSVTVDPASIPAEMRECAFGHGMSQKLGDSLAGLEKSAKDDGASFDATRGWADYATDLLTGVLEDIQSGVWVAESEGGSGGSVGILAEAIFAVLRDNGQEPDEAAQAAIRKSLQDEAQRKKMQGRADVKAHLTRIQAEKAQERAKKARAAAKEAQKGGAETPSILGDLGLS